jgi:phage virion morphogenesis protein
MTTVTVKYNDKQVQDRLSEIIGRAKNMRPAFLEIGEDLVDTTKRRFSSATSPDGTAWAANSVVTVARFLGQTGGNFKKDGSLSKKGAARSAGKKPLTGESRALATTIDKQLKGAAGVSVGSPMEYAAMQQFGGTKSQFPHLWGDIPARPFLGISPADKTNILSIIGGYLTK